MMMWTKKSSSFLFFLLLEGSTLNLNHFVKGKLIRLDNITSLNERVEDKIAHSPGPTVYPTESPAPSPSPSAVPTNDPQRITDAPSAYPTESPAPSPSPSQTPTTAAPSDNPSATPTVSPAPSASPTASAMPSDLPMFTPSDAPSDLPSLSPSAVPTTSVMPSDIPSDLPSQVPSLVPSISPSSLPSSLPSTSPTYTPTIESQRTKTAMTKVFLLNIPREMDDMTMARFEVNTLEFIKQAQPPIKIEHYQVDVLAVTVLTQTVVFPDHYTLHQQTTGNGQHVYKPQHVSEKDDTKSTADATSKTEGSTKNNNRNLLQDVVLSSNTTTTSSSSWDVGLEISFRSVGVVSTGRVPEDFKFEDIVNYGFEHHFNQYLWQLGNSDDFFAPLKEITDWPEQMAEAVNDDETNDDNGHKGAFVTAILFSILAFGVAIYASYYAIRRHLHNKRRRSKKRAKGGNKTSPRYSLGAGKVDLIESSGPEVINYLTNSTNEDSTTNSYHDGDVEGGGALNFAKSIDSDEHSMESIGLTPRGADSPSRPLGFFGGKDSSDASPLKSPKSTCESSKKATASSSTLAKSIKKWMTPRQSIDNYSTTNNISSYNNSRNSTGSKSVRFDPPEKDDKVDCTDTRRTSEPDAKKASTVNKSGVFTENDAIEVIKKRSNDDGDFTLPISFFDADDAESDFMDGGTPMSSLAGSNTSSYFNNIGKSFSGRRSSAGAPSLSGIPSNPTIKENYAFSEASAKISAVPSTVVNNQKTTNRSKNVRNNPKVTMVPKKTGPRSSVSDNSEGSRVQQVVEQIQQRIMEQKQQEKNQSLLPKRTGTNQGHQGFETILGARSRSMEEDEVVQNMPAPSSTPKGRKLYGYSFNQPVVQQKAPPIVPPPNTSATTLGARPLGDNEEIRYKDTDDDARSTLSNVISRPGTYDVYAPSGPIGIVVDTSKKGPSVHSLKSTSPMLGLISAGDLIVAVDNEDTRHLTAAELTRLLAKKSRQKERRITLYSIDGF